ncbi:hypothetical protein HYC85_009151 [Camellia sinensis]|uniref:Uncharacterized protein n=1 Tax=Camellia sinensis TaxID=4442 RepID=A0A7J7HFF7_CAMSI|nr:hypothetical protein HYC85_009151 [Camellia sinensis]
MVDDLLIAFGMLICCRLNKIKSYPNITLNNLQKMQEMSYVPSNHESYWSKGQKKYLLLST